MSSERLILRAASKACLEGDVARARWLLDGLTSSESVTIEPRTESAPAPRTPMTDAERAREYRRRHGGPSRRRDAQRDATVTETVTASRDVPSPLSGSPLSLPVGSSSDSSLSESSLDQGSNLEQRARGNGVTSHPEQNASERDANLNENVTNERGVTARQLAYQARYEAGIARGKGGAFAMLEDQRKHLHQAISTFAKKRATGVALRGDELDGWIEEAAADFAAWVLAQPNPNTAGFYSAFGPRGFLKWLNEQENRKEARKHP